MPDLLVCPRLATSSPLLFFSRLIQVYAMVKSVLADPQDSTATMEVLYQNREPTDVLLKDELVSLAAAHPSRLHLVFACSRANPKEFNTKERTFEQVRLRSLRPLICLYVLYVPTHLGRHLARIHDETFQCFP
jgi:ferredoxin-NADP reductase